MSRSLAARPGAAGGGQIAPVDMGCSIWHWVNNCVSLVKDAKEVNSRSQKTGGAALSLGTERDSRKKTVWP